MYRSEGLLGRADTEYSCLQLEPCNQTEGWTKQFFIFCKIQTLQTLHGFEILTGATALRRLPTSHRVAPFLPTQATTSNPPTKTTDNRNATEGPDAFATHLRRPAFWRLLSPRGGRACSVSLLLLLRSLALGPVPTLGNGGSIGMRIFRDGGSAKNPLRPLAFGCCPRLFAPSGPSGNSLPLGRNLCRIILQE